MTIEEAKGILTRHNEWRRGAEVEPTNPTQLGIAIDTVLTTLSELEAKLSDHLVDVNKMVPEPEHECADCKHRIPRDKECDSCDDITDNWEPIPHVTKYYESGKVEIKQTLAQKSEEAKSCKGCVNDSAIGCISVIPCNEYDGYKAKQPAPKSEEAKSCEGCVLEFVDDYNTCYKCEDQSYYSPKQPNL